MMEAEARGGGAVNDTRRRLLDFVRGNPSANLQAVDRSYTPPRTRTKGRLLEGMDKTMDHRFYVEESDHRRLWNEVP